MPLVTPYLIPTDTGYFHEEIKKSRFLTYIAHTENREQAKAFIQTIRNKHPDARHHCWAFIASRPEDSQQWGFSDDGEPGGTAGKPILMQLQGSDLGEICAVVVRYSGGIKLGTGGLVRAYGGGVRGALEALEITQKIPETQFRTQCDYNQLKDLEYLLRQHQGRVINTQYSSCLELECAIATTEFPLFKQVLTNRFQDNLKVQVF